jgi:hypothetical protein
VQNFVCRGIKDEASGAEGTSRFITLVAQFRKLGKDNEKRNFLARL